MKFEQRFLMVIEQDAPSAIPEVSPGDPAVTATADQERTAMSSTLDQGIKPEDYDIPVPANSQTDQIKKHEIEELKKWIAHIDNFIEYLNSPTPTSIQSKLHAAGCDTIFDDIARSEKKKIARLAAELSSLSESLKGYLISSNA